MPVKRTTSGGRPAFKWGDSGRAYTYTPGDAVSRDRARSQAEAQGRAVAAAQARRGKGGR